VALYMAFIFVLSSIPRPPDLPGGMTDVRGHALLYSGLGALLVRAWAGGWDRPVSLVVALTAVMVATLYGISDEIHQHFVPPREPDIRDVAADAVGAAIAAGVLYARAYMADVVRKRGRAAEAERRRGV
jgi:VanZ family protein